jgi:hypothetical protein
MSYCASLLSLRQQTIHVYETLLPWNVPCGGIYDALRATGRRERYSSGGISACQLRN